MDSTYSAFCNSLPYGIAHCKVYFDENNAPHHIILVSCNSYFSRCIKTIKEDASDRSFDAPFLSRLIGKTDIIKIYLQACGNDGTISLPHRIGPKNYELLVSISNQQKTEFVITLFDMYIINEINRHERTLETHYRQYIENAPDAIFICDEYARYLDANPAAEELLGYSGRELTDLSILDVVTPEYRNQMLSEFSLLKVRGKGSGVVEILRKNGKTLFVSINAVKLPNGHYMAFCRDVTFQRLVETEKDRYNAVFNLLTQPIIITDPSGKIIQVNDAFTKVYGYNTHDLINQTPSILNPGIETYIDFGYTEQEYRTLFDGLWQSVSDPHTGKWEGIVVNRTKDGYFLWAHLYVNSYFDGLGLLKGMIGLPVDISRSLSDENQSRTRLFHTIAQLAELRDDETGNHMFRVGRYAKLLASAAGMGSKYCNDIEIFAPMHDIGKVGIQDSILRAPRKLTHEEFEIMKSHTVLGHNIVKGKKEFELAAAITLHHHEHYDGSGYPFGLKADDIPLSARITAICDVYDALRSERVYKKPWSKEQASEYIIQNAESLFDPVLVNYFQNLVGVFDEVYCKITF